LVRKPDEKRPLGRWEYNIKMDLKEVRWVGMDWAHLIQGRDHCHGLVNMKMKLQVP
jgi:hypothetical protein